MQKLPDSIADHLWKGCVSRVETQETKHPGWEVITRIELSHPESPIVIIYTFDRYDDRPDITISGLFQAGNRDIQNVLPIISRLREVMSGYSQHGKALAGYDEAFRRLEAGEDYDTVKNETMASMGVSSDAFHQAMYRRRENKKRRITQLENILEKR